MNTNIRNRVALITVLLGLVPGAFAQGTAFTYQGQLNSYGSPASGSYLFQFKLYDDAAAGTQQGSTQSATLAVTNGYFMTTLDFGNVFDGTGRWLEITVKTNRPVGPYTTLAPRQPLTATPYAIVASSASNLSGSLPASQVSGTFTLAQLPADLVTNNASNLNLAGTFAGNGASLTNLSASQVASGTLADALLSTNVALLNADQTFTGQNTYQNMLQMQTNLMMNSQDLLLKDDQYHGLGYYGNGKSFGSFLPDGPVLYGYSSGGLGYRNNNLGTNAVLTWDTSGKVGVFGSLVVDAGNTNNGGVTNFALTFGVNSGEGIASKRTAGGNHFGLDIYAGWDPRISILNTGNVGIGKANPLTLLDVNGTVTATSFSGSGAGLSNVPLSALPANLVTNNASNLNLTGTFAGNGASLTNLSASQVASGTLADARLSTNVALLNADQTFTGQNTYQKMLQMQTNLMLNSQDLLLKNDRNHGLGYYGNGKSFGTFLPDGPVLYGYSSGGLGYRNNNLGTNAVLTWDTSGKVGVFGSLVVDAGNTNNGGVTNFALSFGVNSGEGIASKRTPGGNQFGVDIYAGWNPRISILNTGNVGVGKTNPLTLLDVNGTVSATSFSGSGAGLTNLPLSALPANILTNNASTNYAVALSAGVATGWRSTALGGATASGGFSTALGLSTTASGEESTALGASTTASGQFATALGQSTTASGSGAIAAGYRAKALHPNTFVWADSLNLDFSSTAGDQFLIRAQGNVGINTNNPQSTLHVNGTVGVTSTLYADANGVNNGSLSSGLVFGGPSSGEGLCSRRASGTGQYCLDLYIRVIPCA